MADIVVFDGEEPDGEEDKVGYKRPPKEHQFKPGGRGGPGRPKGSKNLKNLIHKHAARKISVKLDGRSVTLSSGEALLLRVFRDGIAGKPSAMKQVLKLIEQYGFEDEKVDTAAPNFDVLTLEEMNVFMHLSHKIFGEEEEWAQDQAQHRDRVNERTRIFGGPLRTEADDHEEYRQQFAKSLEENAKALEARSDEDELVRANRLRAAQGLSPLRADDLDDPPDFDDDEKEEDDEEED